MGWLPGDLIAGLTVGMVVVPQSMSYAQVSSSSGSMMKRYLNRICSIDRHSSPPIRPILFFRRRTHLLRKPLNLSYGPQLKSPQFFATSKDVSIGPVAVMSLTVAQIISSVNAKHPGEWSGPQIATTVAFVCGFTVLGIGLLRLGWIVEFIPAPAVSGFMTGSAINIVSGQVPGLMGITGFK